MPLENCKLNWRQSQKCISFAFPSTCLTLKVSRSKRACQTIFGDPSYRCETANIASKNILKCHEAYSLPTYLLSSNLTGANSHLRLQTIYCILKSWEWFSYKPLTHLCSILEPFLSKMRPKPSQYHHPGRFKEQMTITTHFPKLTNFASIYSQVHLYSASKKCNKTDIGTRRPDNHIP